MMAAISGNLIVVTELISQHQVNVDTRMLIDLYVYGLEKGMTALALSAAMCPQIKAHAIVSALLSAGADPNASNKQGTSPLIAAVVYQSLEGVRALLAHSTLDLEHGLKANHATALGIAAFTSTTAIVEALIQAGANRKHVEDGGGNKLTDACSNPTGDARMLEMLCQQSDGNVNDPMKARTLMFCVIDWVCQTAVRLGLARSLLVMGRAHCQGSTPLHMAARAGNTEVAAWLLKNGAEDSLHAKNAMGCRPIDLATLFGPHVAVEGLLGQAMVIQARSTTPASHVQRSRKAAKVSQLQAARSGETAIRMQYSMWLMPIAEFITLSELKPHQELRAAGKLVKWNATMQNVFFLSHQWTSFERPDHSTLQLRTVQKVLIRMLSGKLPKTAPTFSDTVRLPSKIQISPREWAEIVPDAYVWMDYISVRKTTRARELQTV